MRRLFAALLCLLACASLTRAQPTGTRPHKGTERFNTIWVKSFVPCGANQFVTGWSVTTGVPQCVQPTSSMLADVSSLLKTTGAQKVTGLQVVPRQCVLADAATITPDIDLCDDLVLNSLSTGVTINAPTGTGGNPTCNQQFSLRIKSAAVRTIAHNAIFSANGRVTLPTATTGDGAVPGYDYYLYRYNCDELKWNILANNQFPPAEITVNEVDGTPSGLVNQLEINNGTLVITGKKASITFPTGGGGGTGTVNLPVTGVQLSGLGGVTPAVIDSALNNRALVFDSSIAQCAIWDFTVPADYTGNPVWKYWYAKQTDTTSTNTLQFDVSVMKLLSTASVEDETGANGYDSINVCLDTTTPSAVNQLDTALGNSCPLTSFDTAVAGNAIKLKVCHNPSDSMTGLIRLYRAAFYYTR